MRILNYFSFALNIWNFILIIFNWNNTNISFQKCFIINFGIQIQWNWQALILILFLKIRDSRVLFLWLICWIYFKLCPQEIGIFLFGLEFPPPSFTHDPPDEFGVVAFTDEKPGRFNTRVLVGVHFDFPARIEPYFPYKITIVESSH